MAVLGSPITRSHLNTPSGLDALDEGLRKAFFMELDLLGEQFSGIFNIATSGKAEETDLVFSAFGTVPEKAEGAAYNYDSAQSAWNKLYTHLEYQLGYAITRVAREDELYGLFNRLSLALARSANYTREVRAMDLFNLLSATVYSAGGSNFTLLSTSHFRVDGGTRSNTFTTPADLSVEALESALSQWRTGMVDQRGLKFNIQPSVLLVGPTDEFVAKRILLSNLRPGGNDNDLNVVRTERNLRVMVSDFITDDGRWFLVAPKAKIPWLVWFNRAPISKERFDDVNTGNMNESCRWRSSSGATDITGIWGST